MFMSNMENVDKNEKKLIEIYAKYEKMVEEILENENFLEDLARESNFNRVGEIRGALIYKIKQYKTNEPERARIAPLLSAVNARYKKVKPKSGMEYGDVEYLSNRKEKTI